MINIHDQNMCLAIGGYDCMHDMKSFNSKRLFEVHKMIAISLDISNWIVHANGSISRVA